MPAVVVIVRLARGYLPLLVGYATISNASTSRSYGESHIHLPPSGLGNERQHCLPLSCTTYLQHSRSQAMPRTLGTARYTGLV